MNYLEEWVKTLLSAQSKPMTGTVRVEGVRKAHLGPRMDFAEVVFVVEAASAFEARVEIEGPELSADQQYFISWAIFGFLDVVMVGEARPLRDLRLTVVGAKFDSVSASAMAFRLAGRDAGHKLLEAIQPGSRPVPKVPS